MSSRSGQPDLRIALLGNPNCGKTTVFNALTGMRQKVGNYPGVTVDRRVGRRTLATGQELQFVDLPGTYSLWHRSPDERVAVDYLVGRIKGEAAPELILNVCDASCLGRNLYLTTQLLELGRPVVVALNMMDLAQAGGCVPDAERLSEHLGVPVVPLWGHDRQQMDALCEGLVRASQGAGAKPRVAMVPPVEAALARLTTRPELAGSTHSERLAGLFDEDDGAMTSTLVQERTTLESTLPNAWKSEAPQRYAAIDAWLQDVLPPADAACRQLVKKSFTQSLDGVLLHRFLGPLIFVAVMGLVFQGIFTWATFPSDLMEAGFGLMTARVSGLLGPGMFRDLVVDGILAGVLNVLVFLPQIVVLFLAIGLLEDFGYLSRAAFLVDRLMRKLGLHGKAFVPMMSSFACAIPGVMSARTIENPGARLVTILVAPLMSCSARLPVYTLVIGAFFGGQVWGGMSAAGLILLSLYLLGIVAAAAMAWLLRRTLLKGQSPALVMELPPYRMPRLGAVVRQVGAQALLFLRKVWTVILALTVILWFLQSFPRNAATQAEDQTRREEWQQLIEASPNDASRSPLEAELADFERQSRARRLEQSFAGRIGRGFEPLIQPLGFDWRIGIGLLASFAAREVLVSTMAQVFAVEDSEDAVTDLETRLREAQDPATGKRLYRPLVGLSLAVFFVLACQCMSTVAVVRRETASWRWPLFMVAYMTVLAWCASFVTYQVGSWMGF